MRKVAGANGVGRMPGDERGRECMGCRMVRERGNWGETNAD